MKNKIKKNGFTLIELLVVIAIVGILTMVSVSSYRNAQIKAKDSQRKSDLNNLSKALMMYYNDNGVFPNLTSNQIFGNEAVGLTGPNGITYMRKTPKELTANWPAYVYEVSGSKKSFNLFADLENRNDSQCVKSSGDVGSWVRGGNDYCYGVASPNTTVGDTKP